MNGPDEANDKAGSDAYLAQVTVGERKPHDAPIDLAPYDPAWPALYAALALRIRAALSDQALVVEHVGSTAVPGLCAKPIIDIVLAVPDSSNEPSYVPALGHQGFHLRLREPDWFAHRLLNACDVDTNLHVFSAGCPEINRLLVFRDCLRAKEFDRLLYERTKLALAKRTWRHVQDYADAKSEVVRAILSRALDAPSR